MRHSMSEQWLSDGHISFYGINVNIYTLNTGYSDTGNKAIGLKYATAKQLEGIFQL